VLASYDWRDPASRGVPPPGTFDRCPYGALARGTDTIARMVVLHFVASWAEPVCAPHRLEVRQAAERLGMSVREVDVDSEMQLAGQYGVMQVPAVALAEPSTPYQGAISKTELIAELQARRDGIDRA
jgi:hypothetical protein